MNHTCPGSSSPAADCGGSGSANGAGKAGKAEGDAGPSCSSSKAVGDSKSRFFDDSEESDGEEEGSEEEVTQTPELRSCLKTSLTLRVLNMRKALYLYDLFFLLIRMVAKKTMVTAVRWKKRRIQMMERKTLKMKRRRRKCAFLEWTGKRRCEQKRN